MFFKLWNKSLNAVLYKWTLTFELKETYIINVTNKSISNRTTGILGGEGEGEGGGGGIKN